MSQFHRLTVGDPPNPLLVQTLERMQLKPGRALDLGCGSGRDTLELLRRGWSVVAVDQSDEGLDFLRKQTSEYQGPRLRIEKTKFEDFRGLPDKVDLLVAYWALPFCPQTCWPQFWEGVVSSIDMGGVISAQFFGPNDDWATERGSAMTFHGADELSKLLNGFDVKFVNESEEDKTSRTGRMKHWHIFDVVAVKM